jgi:hypothetical protein
MKKKMLIPLLLALMLMTGQLSFGQDVPPPPTDHGLNDNSAPGGGAPIGGGALILLALGGVYGGIKTYYRIADKEK